MKLKLTGKTGLVTGFTAGFEFGIARWLLQEGSEKFISGLAQERWLSKEDVDRAFFEKISPTSLLERFATIDEVATFVTYLASPLAAANNGAALRVDGGTVSTIL